MKVLFRITLLLLLLLVLCSCHNESHAQTDLFVTSSIDMITLTEENDTLNINNSVTSDYSESKKSPDLNGEWYLSEWERYPSIPPIEQIENKKGINIKVPLVHENNSNGLIIKVEFFSDTYSMYSFIQTRVTYTNATNKKIRFNAKNTGTPGIFQNENGKTLYPTMSKNIESLITHNVHNVILEPGESYTDEIVFFMDTFFDLNGSYTYSVKVYQYSSTEETKIYGFTLPIEVFLTTE